MSNQIETIRAEIERRIAMCKSKDGRLLPPRTRNAIAFGELKYILSFIDSLPAKENPILVPESKETHSLREWAQILATNPDLRAEFDKLCPPQPIQGSIAPEVDVDKWVVTNAFLHCEKAGKIVSEMYGDKLNNPRNRDKYLAFLQQVNLDDRFGELAEILQRYGAMPAPKEQPEADLEAEAERFLKTLPWRTNTPPIPDEYLDEKTYLAIARNFAEWGAEHLKR